MGVQQAITQQQLLELRRALVDNVRELALDAKVLHEAGRETRALALAVFSMEEMVKLFVVDAAERTLRAGQPVDWVPLWKEMTNHMVKTGLMVLLGKGLQQRTPQTFDELTSLFQGELPVKEAADLQRKKEDALYVGFSQNRVRNPSAAVGPELAKSSLGIVDGITKLLNSIDWDD